MTPLADLIERARTSFEATFGRAPTHAAAAPGRVNLIGEHTDYNGGFVLPIAIDRWTVAVAAPASSGTTSRVWSVDLDERAVLNAAGSLIESQGHCGLAQYAAGIATLLMRNCAALPCFDLLLASTIPIGKGLASSAALTTSMAMVLEKLSGFHMDRLERAAVCREVEHEFAGTPCGMMDVVIASLGQPNAALLIDCHSLHCEPVPLPRTLSILIADTGVSHRLASSAYAERRAACGRAAAKLGVQTLREATSAMVQASDELTDVERRRALHVVHENDRVRAAVAALRRGDDRTLGELIFASHDSLRDLYEVSCPELDRIVDAVRAMREAGEEIIGARMTGGGFGGCAVVLCTCGSEGRVINQLRPFAADVWIADAVDGAKRIAMS